MTPVSRSSLSSPFFTSIIAVPLSVAIAILKYRLYDVDLIINRTLVYGWLTALLALVYVGGVVGVGGLVRGLTGQERNNLVVAASTLAVAGLFRPPVPAFKASSTDALPEQVRRAADTYRFLSENA